MIKHIENLEQFNELIKGERVLVDFFATWCGPCRMLTPVLEEVSEDDKDLLILKVDCDQLPEIASKYGVRSIPSLFFVSKGAIVRAGVGFMDAGKLKNFVKI